MVREQSIESFYTRLRDSALASASTSPLLVFPSTSDVDSLCALRIIGHVLESDSVRYACYPVSSFKEIYKYTGDNLGAAADEPITILLINWGCQRDLKKERHGKGKAEACSFHILWLEPRLLPHFNGEKPLLTSMSQGVI